MATFQPPQRVVTLGKTWILGGKPILLQWSRLYLPRAVEAGIMAEELQDSRIDAYDRGHISFNVKSTGRMMIY